MYARVIHWRAVVASVDITVLGRFTELAEFGGLFLTAEHGVEFGARNRRPSSRT